MGILWVIWFSSHTPKIVHRYECEHECLFVFVLALRWIGDVSRAYPAYTSNIYNIVPELENVKMCKH